MILQEEKGLDDDRGSAAYEIGWGEGFMWTGNVSSQRSCKWMENNIEFKEGKFTSTSALQWFLTQWDQWIWNYQRILGRAPVWKTTYLRSDSSLSTMVVLKTCSYVVAG